MKKDKRCKRIGSLFIGLTGMIVLTGFWVLGVSLAQMDQMGGMDSEKMKMPMKKPGGAGPEGQVPVTLTPHKQRLIGVKTVTVTEKALETVIRTIGRVDYDETTLITITTKIEGWIEALSVDATGMTVAKGEPLFSVYSPKLVQTQEEYLLARQASKNIRVQQVKGQQGEDGLAAASRRRLLLWDVTPEQIRDLEARGEIVRALPILSPAGGVVTEKMALQGMYVKPGMPLYKIADLSQVWVYADIYESELDLIKAGQKATVTLSYLPGERFQGEVTYIYPYLNEARRTATARLVFDNADGKLKPGMYANVEITAPVTRGLAVPESAVLDSGLRQVAFVAKAGGLFEPREIKVGQRINHDIIVLEGLREGEKVVTHGTFLIDSESKMMASMEGMMGLIGMGDWKMEGSKMGEMDMGGMDMGGMKMDGMDMGDGKMDGMPNMEMPQSEESPSSTNEVTIGGLKLRFTTEPAMPKKGETTLRLRVTDDSGRPVTNADARFAYTMAMPGMEVETLRAKGGKDGMYTAVAFLGMKGLWEVETTVSRPNQSPVTAKFKIRVGG